MKSIHAIWSLLFFSCSAIADGVRLEDAWIRAAPPGARVLAGYARLENPGRQDVRIVSAHGDAFAAVELHEMRMDGGMMRMRALDGLDVPAGASVAFAPGGLHLMLKAPQRGLRVGDEVEIELKLEDGTSVSATFMVRDPP